MFSLHTLLLIASIALASILPTNGLPPASLGHDYAIGFDLAAGVVYGPKTGGPWGVGVYMSPVVAAQAFADRARLDREQAWNSTSAADSRATAASASAAIAGTRATAASSSATDAVATAASAPATKNAFYASFVGSVLSESKGGAGRVNGVMQAVGARHVMGADASGTGAIVRATGRAAASLIVTPPGAFPRAPGDILGEVGSITRYGAKCDNATDDTSAIQNALNNNKFVLIPQASDYCIIRGTLSVPTGATIFSPASGVNYNGAANCLKKPNSGDLIDLAGGDNTFSGVCFVHTGATGKIVSDNGSKLGNNTFWKIGASATHASNNEPLIYLNSTNNAIQGSSISNQRPTLGSWAIYLDATTQINISNRIEGSIFTGANPNVGPDIYVGSSVAGKRQEGTMIKDNQFISQNVHIWLQGCLSCHIMDNELDQGWDYNVVIAPGDMGVSNVRFSGNYFSTPSKQTTGICLHSIDTGYGAGNIIFETNDFAFCGYVDDFGSNISSVTFSNNNIVAIRGGGISFNGSTGNNSVTGNKFSALGAGVSNLTIADGAGDGRFVVDGNGFQAGNPVSLSRAASANFALGANNTGVKLAGRASAIFSVSSCKPQYVNIAHGLASAPDRSKIQLTTFLPGTGSAGVINPNMIVAAVDNTSVTIQWACGIFLSSGTAGVAMDASM